MSKLENIKAKLAKILASFDRMSTDKGILEWEGDDELTVGSPVHIIDEDGNEQAAEDGEYKNAEGDVFVVADGKVSEIRETENDNESEDVETEEVSASKEKFNKVKAAFEASYEEKEMKIAEAIRAKGLDAWLIEAGDDYAIAEVWNDEDGNWHYERFAISWDEEGNVVVGESEEVKSMFVPVDAKSPFEEESNEENEENEEPKAEEMASEEEPVEEPAAEEEDKDKKIEDLEAEVARLEEENGELKERIKELEDESAAEPVQEEFEKVVNTNATGDKGLDRLNRILSAK